MSRGESSGIERFSRSVCVAGHRAVHSGNDGPHGPFSLMEGRYRSPYSSNCIDGCDPMFCVRL